MLGITLSGELCAPNVPDYNRGSGEKHVIFKMAPGLIRSIQIPSDRSQNDVNKFSYKKIGWKVSVGGVNADIFAHSPNTQFYMLFEPYLHNPEHTHMEPFEYAKLLT